MGKKISTLYYTNLAHSINAIAFCVDKGIKIYAVPKNDKEYYVEVNDNDEIDWSLPTLPKTPNVAQIFDIGFQMGKLLI